MVIRERLAADGYVVLPDAAPNLAEPWRYITELLGERPEMVERQPIRPHARGVSYASTAVFTPFHTDSQDYLGAPPGLQVMACHRAAARGGQTRLVDGRALLERIASRDRALHDALLHEPRRQRFYFGDVVGPTVATKRGHLVWTLSPIPHDDPVGVGLARELASAPVIELAVREGDVLLVDNHRMLHGRSAFEGERDFTRLLAWFTRAPSAGDRRLELVLDMLTGGAPPLVARRGGITEAELYALRSRALAAARAALEEL